MIPQRLKTEIAWSTLVQVGGKFLQIGLSVLTLKLLLKGLGKDAYGEYGRITEYCLFFATAGGLGLFGEIVRKMSEKPQDGQFLFNAYFLRAFTAMLFFSAALIYAFFFIRDTLFLSGCLFFLASLFLDYSSSVGQAALQANYCMGRAVFATTLGKATELGLVFLLMRNEAALPLYFLAPLAASLLISGLTLLFVQLKTPLRWKLDTQLWHGLFWAALPFGIINIVNSLYFRFIPDFFANEALTDAHFGNYSLLLGAVQTLAILSTFYMFSALPALRQALKEEHPRRAQELFKTSFKLLSLLGIAFVVFGWLLGPPLITLVSHKDFLEPSLWFMLPMLLTIGALSYLYDLVLITLFALGMEIWQLKREVFAVLCCLLICLLSLGPWTEEVKIFIVLLAAILSELLIVFLGLRHLREKGLFQKATI